MKHDYTALDSAILQALKSGAKTFRSIESYPKVKDAATVLEQERNASFTIYEKKPAWRFIGSRLESLSQNGGPIIHTNATNEWSLKDQA